MGRVVQAMVATLAAGQFAVGAPFTPVADGMQPFATNIANEYAITFNEHRWVTRIDQYSPAGVSYSDPGPSVPALETGLFTEGMLGPAVTNDVGPWTYWREMQQWVSNNCQYFVNHELDINGAMTNVTYFTWPTLLDVAGMSSYGFRRAKVWNPDTDNWKNVDDAMYSQAAPHDGGHDWCRDGDIFGPWIYDDLQRAYSALRWTCASNYCHDAPPRHITVTNHQGWSVTANHYDTVWELGSYFVSVWNSRTWGNRQDAAFFGDHTETASRPGFDWGGAVARLRGKALYRWGGKPAMPYHWSLYVKPKGWSQWWDHDGMVAAVGVTAWTPEKLVEWTTSTGDAWTNSEVITENYLTSGNEKCPARLYGGSFNSAYQPTTGTNRGTRVEQIFWVWKWQWTYSNN